MLDWMRSSNCGGWWGMVRSKADALAVHGVDFSSEQGEQLIGECPFCRREGKFFCHKENLLCDCKVCGRSGNLEGFLSLAAERNAAAITPKQRERLSQDRGLPLEAFDDWGIGYFDGHYTIPVRGVSGKVQDIRRWKPGGKVLSTPGCKTSLLGIENLIGAASGGDAPVFVAEGEWDAIGLRWLLRASSQKGAVVGVPGASVFKPEWIQAFEGREAVLCYDNDEAGDGGDAKAREMLQGTVKGIRSIHWPEGLDAGHDVRDFIVRRLFNRKPPRKIIGPFFALLKREGRALGGGVVGGDAEQPIIPGEERPEEGLSPEEGIALFRRWLVLPDIDPLLVIFGVIFGNRIDWKDPVWLELIGASGGGKSAILSSLWTCPGIYSITALTPKSLASGAVGPGGTDPSLTPRLHEKILNIKDFSAVLSMTAQDQAEIFGALRDLYDGKFSKVFGTGIRRTYTTLFGVIAGCTPAIDAVLKDHGLGERFIKFRLPAVDDALREAISFRAMQGSGEGQKKDADLARAAHGMLAWKGRSEIPPTISTENMRRIFRIAQWTGFLRGVVLRNQFTDEVLARPLREEPTRLCIQLAKLARGVSWFLGQSEVGEDGMRIAERCARDTPRDRDTDIIEALVRAGGSLPVKALCRRVNFPQSTVYRRLQDLEIMCLVKIKSFGAHAVWRLHPAVRGFYPYGDAEPTND
mgnify:CR=1 FL=1